MGTEHDPSLRRSGGSWGAWYVFYGGTKALAGNSGRHAPRPNATKRAAIRAKRKHVHKHKVEERADRALVRATEKLTDTQPALAKIRRLFVREDQL